MKHSLYGGVRYLLSWLSELLKDSQIFASASCFHLVSHRLSQPDWLQVYNFSKTGKLLIALILVLKKQQMTKTSLLKVFKKIIKSPNNIVLLSSIRKIQFYCKHQREGNLLSYEFLWWLTLQPTMQGLAQGLPTVGSLRGAFDIADFLVPNKHCTFFPSREALMAWLYPAFVELLGT